ncbi:MAG TPA: phosphatidylserine decarboxylase family protein [Candidatus Acidoferrales bacterium]|jgi:phosphatidylserine decarboxylase|nr:phosphatidylserine decarboxylase family protein [Candidatus Acidoferrales bacterium]
MVKEGYKFSAAPFALGVLALLRHWNTAGGVLVLLAAFVLYFFRDPERVAPSDPAAVVSPADGRIVEVLEESVGSRPGRRVSIFLSIWDVHVNRAPVAGRIARLEYRPGRFYVAMRSRASAENEQNIIHLDSARGEVVFKQIAGWIARRVLCWKAEGDAVALGERVGMIRFGSRVDLWLPAEAEIVVRRGQHVKGGSSILARWP